MANLIPPVISLRPLRGRASACEDGLTQETHVETGNNIGDTAARTVVVEEVAESFKKFGCVCVPVSDLNTKEGGEALLHRCYSMAESFFSLPEASKVVYTEQQAAKQGYGGSCYTPLGKEPAYVEGEKQHVESFSCTRPLERGSCSHLDGGYEFHRNLFPDSHVPDFGESYSSLWEALRESVTLPMMTALEDMLSLPQGFLLSKSVEVEGLNMSLLRTLRYPSRHQHQPPEPLVHEKHGKRLRSTRSHLGLQVNPPMVEVGISEHTDFEVITVMHQDSPGLWLHSPGAAGYWYEPPCRSDVLTVILGDMVELWTSGWLEATLHRVASPGPGQAPRQSLVLFQAHDDCVKVRPLLGKQLVICRPETTLGSAREEQDASNCGQCSRTRGTRHRSKEHRDGEDHQLGSFAEWVRYRPAAIMKKYPPTTQGAWVWKNEHKAKSRLRATS